MNRRILMVLILLHGICIESIGQNLLYTKSFNDTTGWEFFFGSNIDTTMGIMDTSFSGIIDNRLVLWAQQGGGGIGSSAHFTDEAPAFGELESFMIKVFYNTLECFSGWPDNYFITNINGHIICAYFNAYFINNPFVLQIVYDDSLSIKIDDQEVEYYEKDEWFSDPDNILSFNFSVKASRADLMAWAIMEVDSIQIYDLEPVIHIYDNKEDNAGISIMKDNLGYFLYFDNYDSQPYLVSIYNINGQVVHKALSKLQVLPLYEYVFETGIYFIQVILNNQVKTFKISY